MTGQLPAIFSRYGQRITLTTADGKTSEIRGFLQPVRKKQEKAPVTVTALGPVSRQRWLYIGSTEIRPGDQIRFRDLMLQAQESQEVCLGSRTLYYRAILHPGKELCL